MQSKTSIQEVTSRAERINLVIFDIDGVLTDGRLFIGDNGQEYTAFDSSDGFGMRMLQDCGIEIAVITGRRSQSVLHRMQDLGIIRVLQGQRKKLSAFQQLLEDTGYLPDAVAYIGDDIIDLPVMTRVGLSIAVGSAGIKTQQHAHYITEKPGGRGAAREVCELILRAQGKLDDYIATYLD